MTLIISHITATNKTIARHITATNKTIARHITATNKTIARHNCVALNIHYLINVGDNRSGNQE
jgi:hypothetical protein